MTHGMFILEFGCVWRVSLIRVEKKIEWKKNKRKGNEKEGGRGINREEEREREKERGREEKGGLMFYSSLFLLCSDLF